MLELADGTRMTQSNAIMNYLGTVYNLKPKDPLLVHRGQSFQQYFEKDFQYKFLNYPVFYAPKEAKPALLKIVFDVHLPRYLRKLKDTLD